MREMKEAISFNEYVPPTSHMSAAIQTPLDKGWQHRVLNGMLKDTLAKKGRS
jgi:hypothetical protein